MCIKNLLRNELEWYESRNKTLISKKYSIKELNRLFDKFPIYSMTESYYCCNGLEHCCWQDIIEDGVWDLTLSQVKKYIKQNLKNASKYLYNQKKYGKRFFIYESSNECSVFIFMRDKLGVDYSIFFYKNDLTTQL